MSAKRRVAYCQELLKDIGLEPERVRMFNMSSAMAAAFVDAAQEMTAQIAALGPSPLRPKQEEGNHAPLTVAGE